MPPVEREKGFNQTYPPQREISIEPFKIARYKSARYLQGNPPGFSLPVQKEGSLKV